MLDVSRETSRDFWSLFDFTRYLPVGCTTTTTLSTSTGNLSAEVIDVSTSGRLLGMPWTTTHSTIGFQNPWITVHDDQVIRPDGSPGEYGVVTFASDSVYIVALNQRDEVALVHVDRYTTGPGWEIPAGGTDGQDPLVAAQRELQEEAGCSATDWQLVGDTVGLNGVCRLREYVYLARNLTIGLTHEQETEGITAVRWVPWTDLLREIRSSEFRDGGSLTALMCAAVALGRVQ